MWNIKKSNKPVWLLLKISLVVTGSSVYYQLLSTDPFVRAYGSIMATGPLIVLNIIAFHVLRKKQGLENIMFRYYSIPIVLNILANLWLISWYIRSFFFEPSISILSL